MKDKKHLRFVAGLPCYLCGNPEVQVHHLLRAGGHGMGKKTGDEWTIPLCVTHHDMLHRCGDEIQFFADQGKDYERVKKFAIRLWSESRA